MSRALLLFAALVACSTPAAPPAATPTASAPVPAATTGTIETVKFHSDALGVDKHVVVYLPAGYDPHGATRYPVFYYLHGLGGDETNWWKGGKIDAVADAMALQAIIVMPDGDDGFYVDSPAPIDYDDCMSTGAGLAFPDRVRKDTCVRAYHYETYMTKDLVGWVDGRYHTIATREGRGIAGMSMGGLGAFMLAMRHTDLFSAAASHSGYIALLYAGPHPYVAGQVKLIPNPNLLAVALGDMGKWLLARFGSDVEGWRAHDPSSLIATLPPGKLALYLDCGTEDGFKFNDGALYVHDLLTARGIEHEFFLGPGGHDFGFWGPRLPKSLAFLRAHVAAAK